LKSRRQSKILEIIRREIVETQEDLARRLREEGIKVTQATISRDIRELNLIKSPTGDGRLRYAQPGETISPNPNERLKRLIRDCCTNVDHSENIVVVNCLSGTANAVCEAVDLMRWKEIVGTVAGDNTFLIVVRTRPGVQAVISKLKKIMG